MYISIHMRLAGSQCTIQGRISFIYIEVLHDVKLSSLQNLVVSLVVAQ